ncbi:MAG: SpvB/TcaC N-terminal domain-containing protein [Bacteroidota bacterium]|jgi:RHS repeat-associated protein
MAPKEEKIEQNENKNTISAPSISLPNGGGAIRGIGEKFSANPVTGTGSLTVPIAVSPGRSGFGPQLSLAYDSGSGNGPFGFGWSLSLPSITRKTDKGLPKYQDTEDSDVFILSGAEDLVPVFLKDDEGNFKQDHGKYIVDEIPRDGFTVRKYRPRIEGLFARIERWTNTADPTDVFWRSISKDNITTWYGKTENSRIFDPSDQSHIFSWIICQSYDDKGNAIVYEYVEEGTNRIFEDQQGQAVALTHESNRDDQSRSANRYIKRIKYGNTQSRLVQPNLTKLQWLFEIVFDYEKSHYKENLPDSKDQIFAEASLDGNKVWPPRQDPFSSYKAGFEVRTYRLCHRVLMFHHFDELKVDNYLVRSTEFTYLESPVASFITGITQSGYVLSNGLKYLKKSLPPLEFEYSQATINDKVEEIDPESLQNLPVGIEGSKYQLVDLDGEGISGILTEQADAWYYKPSLGNGSFGPMNVVASNPSLASLSSGRQQLLDLAGDGQLDLADFHEPTPGFYERSTDEQWENFRTFKSLPKIAWDDPNLRFVDLNGDGHADILITENEVIRWYPSLAKDGFDSQSLVSTPLDEEDGPRLVFADGTQSIYLADMSGDGLTDLARIRNGEVCYWPNLGYGRFGKKVTMDNSPWFDSVDQFDQKRIRVADIDGSGNTDIIYLHADRISLYFNQSGNGWSGEQLIRQFPLVDNLSSVMTADILGDGTACLVWSSPLPNYANQQMKYIRLMKEGKPHLLISVVNNLGAETIVQYVPSTKFYLEDKRNENPWITRLPFPVHVVERVETYDYISRNRFVTRYAYHHGYFDGIEREFRGFGMVEQWDTEEYEDFDKKKKEAIKEKKNILESVINYNEASCVPPVHTKTWFHNGAYLEGGKISKHFEEEYYRESDLSDELMGLTDEQLETILLDDTLLPDTIVLGNGTSLSYALSVDECREACRSLKGSVLRQEVYAIDKKPDGTPTDEADRPYSVSERNYTIELLQPRKENRHAVFFTHPREIIDFHYERKLYDVNGKKLADPRISHSITLEADVYGNILKSVAIGYGRRLDPTDLTLQDDKDKQQRLQITYTDNRYTNPVLENDDYRIPLLCDSCTYELHKVTTDSNEPFVNNLFHFDKMIEKVKSVSDGAHEVPYEDTDASTGVEEHIYRRPIEHVRTLYRSNDLKTLLPLGTLETKAFSGESYKLAFTPGLLKDIFIDNGKIVAADLENLLMQEGAYVNSRAHKSSGLFPATDPNDNWWIPSGLTYFSPNESDTPAQELAYADQHFFLPLRYRDPFGCTTTLKYDHYDLLLKETKDPIGNIVTVVTKDEAGNELIALDYRVLQPVIITDPNDNRMAVSFDALGLVVGTAVMGKLTENKGGSLKNFNPDLNQNDIDAFFNNPKGEAQNYIQEADTRIIYDVTRYYRDIKIANKPKGNGRPAFAATIACETHASDPDPAGGRKFQVSFSYSDGFGREIQKKIQAEKGPIDIGGAEIEPRWVGNGWTIFNNKGKSFKKYEPFFSNTHDFEHKEQGVCTVLFYDPVGRVLVTLHPNNTYEKVVFDAWRQETWDVNDTVLLLPQNDEHIGGIVEKFIQSYKHPRTGQPFITWYDEQIPDRNNKPSLNSDNTPANQKAALKTEAHAGTPTVAHFDTLGRVFLSIADNGIGDDGSAQLYETRTDIDIEGNQRSVFDAKKSEPKPKGRMVMRYEYDMLGNILFQSSMDAGKRWMLNNVKGNPVKRWDERSQEFSYAYDELQRPLNMRVQYGDRKDKDGNPWPLDNLYEQIHYGDWKGMTDAERTANQKNNLITKPWKHYDTAGKIVFNEYDFKGNSLKTTRQLTTDYKNTVNWDVAQPDDLLNVQSYATTTSYDALNRVTTQTTPDNHIVKPLYNEANFLEQLSVEKDGTITSFIKDINYNEKGQRKDIKYGNDISTVYEYDPDIFRLVHLKTNKANGALLQDLLYTYDPIGNITQVEDKARPTVFFNNMETKPVNDYTYDAIYRLLSAIGREHIAQVNFGNEDNWNDLPFLKQYGVNEQMAWRTYTQNYMYDEVGNIKQMKHAANGVNWTRDYHYELTNNRLKDTNVESNGVINKYEYLHHPQHGFIKKMPHLPMMQWDFKDQLQAISRQIVNDGTPEITYYVYDFAGQRVRKITENSAAAESTPTEKNERIYLGNYEIYKEYSGTNKGLERITLHIMDDKQRIALIETRNDVDDGTDKILIRYQFNNHLGTSCLETNDKADPDVISYEEYHPYGTTSSQAVGSTIKAAAKRYRYTGKERDEESGLYYYGARYYASWLGRWCCCDPVGLVDGVDVYVYVKNNPVCRFDAQGLQQALIDPTDPQYYTSFEDFAQGYQQTKMQSVQLEELQTIWNKYSAQEQNKPRDADALDAGVNDTGDSQVCIKTICLKVENATVTDKNNFITTVNWLTKNYPELIPKSTTEIEFGDPGSGKEGSVDRLTGNITLKPSLSPSELVDTIAHELMHAHPGELLDRCLQNIEEKGLGLTEEHDFVKSAGNAVGTHFRAEERDKRAYTKEEVMMQEQVGSMLDFLPSGEPILCRNPKVLQIGSPTEIHLPEWSSIRKSFIKTP